MTDSAPTVVFLLGRIEALQREIATHYSCVGEATREIQLINNLLLQLRPVPRAVQPVKDEERYPTHPALRPEAHRQDTAESIKGRYPSFPDGLVPQTTSNRQQRPTAPPTISHPLRGRKSIGEILRNKTQHGTS